VSATKIFLLVAQGELDLAGRYLQVVQRVSDPNTIPAIYLSELSWRLGVFTQGVNDEVQQGIRMHDKGDYQAAIQTYRGVLQDYPGSAWARYELFFSGEALALKEKKVKSTEKRWGWDSAKSVIYLHDPLYPLDVLASTGKEAYLLFRRAEIKELFGEKSDPMDDLFRYAQISMDLGVYDFAAQVLWLSVTYDKKRHEEALVGFLYCLERLGVKDIKENFKGDFKAEFEKLENSKAAEMKNSATYKAFKK